VGKNDLIWKIDKCVKSYKTFKGLFRRLPLLTIGGLILKHFKVFIRLGPGVKFTNLLVQRFNAPY